MLNLPAMFSHQIRSTSGWNWGVPNVPLKKSSVPFHLQRIPSIHQHFWLEGKGSEDPHRYYRDRWTMKSPMKSQCVDCGPPWNRDFSRNVHAQKRLPCLGFMEEHTQKKTSIHRVDQPTSTTVGSGNDGGNIIGNCLVVEPPTPLKVIWVRQLGWWLFPIEWKNNPFMFQTTNQIISWKHTLLYVWDSLGTPNMYPLED